MEIQLDTRSIGSLFELSRDAVIGVENGRVAFANPAAMAMLPLRIGDSAARHIPEHILDDPGERFIAAAELGGRSVDFSVVRQGGLTLLSCARRRTTGDDGPAVWDGALRELGSRLLTVRLALDSIVRTTDAEHSPELKPYAATLYQSYYLLKRLHSHMTLVSADAAGRLPFSPRMVSLTQLCAGVCDTTGALIRSMGITLSFEAEDAPCHITGDAGLLETMLLNLLANSLLHCSGGDRLLVSLSQRGRRYVIAIDDPGSGITPERMSSLFDGLPDGELPDPAEGAGLGLAVARCVAEKHGGALIVESRVGKGTCLRVSLPMPEPQSVLRLRQSTPSYRVDGMDAVLTELSVILDKSFYNQRSFD